MPRVRGIGGMKMIEIGRICVKLAGRDAGREAVIVDILDDKYVLVDGNVRRRKCNILHLEPTERKADIKKNASHEDVKEEFSKLKLPVWEAKAKEKGERPRKVRGKKEVLEESAEDMKKTKEEKKAEMKREKLKKKEEKRAEEKTAKEKKPIDARVISVTKKKKEKEVSQK